MKRLVTGLTAVAAAATLVGCAPSDPDTAPSSDATTSTTTSRGAHTAPSSPASSTTVTAPRRVDTRIDTRIGAPFGRSGLAFFDDCAALLEHMQAIARERVTAWGLGWAGGPFQSESAAADSAAGAPEAAPGFSQTNTQEVGVDEGDLVETDGRYVYTVDGGNLRVVEVAGARVVATQTLGQGTHQLLLDGDRLLVASQSWDRPEDTTVALYDVADPPDPHVVGTWHVEGTLAAARAVDGTARLVLASSFAQRLPFVQPSMFGLDEQLALERNHQVIDQSDVEDWLPRLFTEAADGSFGAMSSAVDCSRVGAPDTFSGLGVSWIASLDLHADAPPVGSAGVVSSGETVYASPTALYVATMPWDWYHPVESQQQHEGPPPTQIHQFELTGGTDATYVASGSVPGRLLNQFSLSEHEGVLRVAVTVDATSSTTASSSSVVVLQRDGSDLREISRVDGLGSSEQIYAVRFLGDVGYVVTFRQVDPLYVLDLADPVHPVLQGELKIPGYSAYLHPIGDGLLLGVGQDATDAGRVLGTQLSLFDVSDPRSPQRISTLAIGGWSDAEWDHHAFLYWPDDGTVVLPVTPGWQDCGPNDSCLADQITGSAGGAVVARVTGRALVPVGTVSHDAGSSDCWNPLRRSLVIGDELVTVGPDQMVFSSRADLTARAGVRWGTPDEYGCWGYWQE